MGTALICVCLKLRFSVTSSRSLQRSSSGGFNRCERRQLASVLQSVVSDLVMGTCSSQAGEDALHGLLWMHGVECGNQLCGHFGCTHPDRERGALCSDLILDAFAALAVLDPPGKNALDARGLGCHGRPCFVRSDRGKELVRECVEPRRALPEIT